MIEVTLRRAGQPRQTFDFEPGATVAEFKSTLSNSPATSGIATSRFSVNGEIKEDAYVLQDGDQLMVTSKVDGGLL